jgi:peptide/nickel transport system permease protein
MRASVGAILEEALIAATEGKDMARYIVKRALLTLPILFLTSVIVFGLMRILPGDPVVVIAGDAQADVSPEVLAAIRREHGLDRPIYVQYAKWISKLARGDLGQSIHSRQPVWEIIRPRFMPTIQIGLMAWFLALAIAIPVAVISATSPNSWKDSTSTLGALVGAAIPYFLLAGALIYIVSLRLRWLPASGYVSPFDDPVESLRHTILPSITLGVGLAAVTTRQARSSLVEVLNLAYITTARAKGLRERVVVFRHAFKNAMLPVLTILGIQLGNLLGGAVITETIFAVPGLGRLLVDAIFRRDYPIIQAVVLITSLSVILANLLVDVLYGVLDPRIRY